MEFLKKLILWLDNRKNTIIIANILLLLFAIFLLYKTSSLWTEYWHLFIVVIKPFFISFIIAYVLEPFVEALTTHHLSRPLAIAFIFSVFAIIIVLFLNALIPMLYNKIIALMVPLSNGLTEVQMLLLEHFNIDISNIVDNALSSLQAWLVDLSFMNTTIDIASNLLFTITGYIIDMILAVYFLSDWPRIRKKLSKTARKIHPNLAYCLSQIDHQLMAYVKAFIILMIIQFITFALIYLCIGNPDWMLLGLLAGVSCILPYIGPMLVNILGIITTLGLPFNRLILLLIAIFIQSNVDSYIITPKVYSTQIEIEPIYVLFGLLTGSTLLGAWGMIATMPILVIIKITMKTIKEIKQQ